MISIQTSDFDVGLELAGVRKIAGDVGAVVSFTGLVRGYQGKVGDENGQIQELFLEHYPGMTERALEDIVKEAGRRWDLGPVRVIHRIGSLSPGDQIVLVITCSRHRLDAFAAAEFIMDYLKTRAPFWKREQGRHGSHWVAHRDSDDQAANRWRSSVAGDLNVDESQS